MLGNKCPWYYQCSARKSSGFQGSYCNSEIKSRQCPERPMNYKDDKVAQKFNYAKGSHSNIRFGQVIIIIVGVIITAAFFIPKFC